VLSEIAFFMGHERRKRKKKKDARSIARTHGRRTARSGQKCQTTRLESEPFEIFQAN